jgi:hypothetical protein
MAPATTSLANIPMCRECFRRALDREVEDAEDELDRIERGEIPAPRAVRHRPR